MKVGIVYSCCKTIHLFVNLKIIDLSYSNTELKYAFVYLSLFFRIKKAKQILGFNLISQY